VEGRLARGFSPQLRRVFRTIAPVMLINSLLSAMSLAASPAGPMRHAFITRSRDRDSRSSFNAMQHFEMKSRRLSAARASSSIPLGDVLQFKSCGTIIRPTPPFA